MSEARRIERGEGTIDAGAVSSPIHTNTKEILTAQNIPKDFAGTQQHLGIFDWVPFVGPRKVPASQADEGSSQVIAREQNNNLRLVEDEVELLSERREAVLNIIRAQIHETIKTIKKKKYDFRRQVRAEHARGIKDYFIDSHIVAFPPLTIAVTLENDFGLPPQGHDFTVLDGRVHVDMGIGTDDIARLDVIAELRDATEHIGPGFGININPAHISSSDEITQRQALGAKAEDILLGYEIHLTCKNTAQHSHGDTTADEATDAQ